MKRLFVAIGFVLALVGAAWARVNVNTATQAELEALPEVGAVKAKAIMDYRKKNGPFKSLEDLEKVDGIGEKTIKAIKDQVSFAGASTPVAPEKTPAKGAEKDKAESGKAPGAEKAAANKAMANEKSAGHAKADDKMKDAAAGDAKAKGKPGEDKNKTAQKQQDKEKNKDKEKSKDKPKVE